MFDNQKIIFYFSFLKIENKVFSKSCFNCFELFLFIFKVILKKLNLLKFIKINS